MQPLLDADILAGFRSEIEGYLPSIRAAAVDPSRASEARELARSIQGAASIVGLAELSAAASALGRRLDERASTGIEGAVDSLEEAALSAFDLDDSEPEQPTKERPPSGLALDTNESWISDEERVPTELLPTFQEEAEELLAGIAEQLATLRADRRDESALAALRRHLHTLKGAAGMVGLRNAGRLAHRLEDCLGQWNEEGGEPDPSAFELLDTGADLLEELCIPGPRSGELKQRTLALHHAVARPPVEQPEPATVEEAPQPAPAGEEPRTNDGGSAVFRTPVERIDELLRLSGELGGQHSALEAGHAAWGSEITGLGATARSLHGLAERLESARVASQPRRRAVQPAEQEGQLAEQENSANSGFDELELDRYSEISLAARDITEAAGAIAAAGARLRSIRGEMAQTLRHWSRLQTEQQERLMRLRMAPLSSLRRRLERSVRVASAACGKQAVLQFEGDVELDKSVLDALAGPLEHLLRNAVDHGIESPSQRERAGKPRVGIIRIRAWLDGVQAAIEVEDDGAGFDLDRLRDKAVSAGLLDRGEAADASADQLRQLAFHPGLSTASRVSQISGRGVGLDVVRTAILAASGSLQLQSDRGLGSVFSMRAPTTLAAARLLFVQSAGQTFAVPLYRVLRVAKSRRSDVTSAEGEAELRTGAGQLPLVQLSEALGLAGSPLPETFPTLMIQAGDKRFALAVEELGESRDAIIKSLGPLLRNARGVTGGAVLGDGGVCLVLNPAELLAPARAAAPPVAEPALGIPALNRPAPQQPLHILVVDDSLSVRTVASGTLESQGWQVDTARDGLEAAEALESSDIVPDALLLDVEMPRMDGYELLALLRKSPRHNRLPIVMLTSRAGEKHRQRAMELGANGYLVKPFDPQELVAVLRQAAAGASGDNMP